MSDSTPGYTASALTFCRLPAVGRWAPYPIGAPDSPPLRGVPFCAVHDDDALRQANMPKGYALKRESEAHGAHCGAVVVQE